MFGSYPQPITYNLSVFWGICKYIYRKPLPSLVATVRSAYETMWARAINRDFWFGAVRSGDIARIGVYVMGFLRPTIASLPSPSHYHSSPSSDRTPTPMLDRKTASRGPVYETETEIRNKTRNRIQQPNRFASMDGGGMMIWFGREERRERWEGRVVGVGIDNVVTADIVYVGHGEAGSGDGNTRRRGRRKKEENVSNLLL
ncbi:hypothetical protein D9758_004925 [Tetrapyrgos nigripes]|uniref:Uncharacterized protein n=1 Tax=Tetrapyrgos nigripes TaxID=182062 RepID=A0A8H5GW18_9AGAR|nr:hypothetical protein D9758_004925 [Tetrapyrgos nigripes]